MTIYVNDGANKEVRQVFVKTGGVWKSANEVYVKHSGAWELVHGVTYVSLSGDSDGLIKNFNLATYLGVTSPAIFSITVAAATNFVSTSNIVPAFDVGSLPVGSTVRLSLPSDSSITGRGGNGGYGSDSEGGGGLSGDFGGTGLYTRFPISLTNNGVIGGGGGGGGGGGSRRVYNPAGNGGGGAGGYHEEQNSDTIDTTRPPGGTNTGLSPGNNRLVPAGFGGIGAGPRTDGSTSPAAADGTKTTGGAGSCDVYGSRCGGAGGNLGNVGTSSSWAGGAAGNAIDGHSYITYVTSGTISGGQVN